ncbi:Cyclic di-GMP phosphodiesterase TM_0186 [Durusdinium trenchii]|uniref:Cyclic di-GMP phosphodiesterase TM_0186 n=1 Tax=Durusdinium trenchii TaxID=1381693 RepID=A0ABP0IV70_9DINO
MQQLLTHSTGPSHEQHLDLLRIAEEAFDSPFALVERDIETWPSDLLSSVDLSDRDRSEILTPRPHVSDPLGDGRRLVAIPVDDEEGNRRHAVAIVDDGEPRLLEKLAETTAVALRQQVELKSLNDPIEEYTRQISRDFEEIVWMRSLAEQIGYSSLRDPFDAIASNLFPPLLDLLQAQEVFMVTYKTPVRRNAPSLPRCDGSRTSAGNARVADNTLRDVIEELSADALLQPLVLNIVREEYGPGRFPNVRSIILVPLKTPKSIIGWIGALNRLQPDTDEDGSGPIHLFQSEDNSFGTFEAGLMESAASFLASHANNISLFAEQEQLLIGIVRAMVNAVDAKDPYTCGHSDRVALMSRQIAREMGLAPKTCEEIFLAGLLHDIGKIGVPDNVLLKPGRLTDEEYEQIKQHPVIGYKVLQHLDKISYVLPGVLHHHESVDGTGYPSGLAGDEIPLQARILAVADSFDAMTSDRPYRKGMPFEKAESIIRENAGKQWDADVVDAFFRAENLIRAICLAGKEEFQSLLSVADSEMIHSAVNATHD